LRGPGQKALPDFRLKGRIVRIKFLGGVAFQPFRIMAIAGAVATVVAFFRVHEALRLSGDFSSALGRHHAAARHGDANSIAL